MDNTKPRKATAMLGLLVLLAAACSTDPTVASSSEVAGTTTISEAASTSSEPLAEVPSSSTPEEEDDDWDAITGWSGVSFGTVRTLFFEPAFTFDAPEGAVLLCPPGPTHTGISTRTGTATGPLVPSGGVPAGLHALVLADSTVDETVTTLTAGVASPTDPQPTTVGGVAGLTFDGAAPEDAGTLYISPSGDCTMKFDIAERLRFWVVEPDGVPVVFALYAPSDDFETYAAELQPVIDSVRWRTLNVG